MLAPNHLNFYFMNSPKLGFKPAPPAMLAKIPRLENYMRADLGGKLPERTEYATKARASLATMLMNDRLGCCTVSAAGHHAGLHSAARPDPLELVMTDREVADQYPRICGAGDRGCYIPQVLNWWRDRGLSVAGKQTRIEGYALVNPANTDLMKRAILLFGGLHVGFLISQQQYQNARPGGRWTTDRSPLIGGHSVYLTDYDPAGYTVSTWGILCGADPEVFAAARAQSEVYVILGREWYNDRGISGAGVDVERLRADLGVIGSGGVPDLPDPEPMPVPVPPPEPKPEYELVGVLDFFGQMLPLKLQPKYVAGLSLMERSPTIWVIVSDVAELLAALRARDWAGVARAAEKLLRDLGVTFTVEDRASIMAALEARAETLDLDTPLQRAENKFTGHAPGE